MTASVANPYFVSTVLWVLLSPFLYGFHIAALNQIQSTIQCDKSSPLIPPPSLLPVCIPMSNATFGLVTSVFTIGGLFGSLASNYLMNRFGRKGAAKFNAGFILVGSVLMALAWSSGSLMFGRFVVGIGAGIAMCVGPVFLSEIAPQTIKGSVGVLNQLSVVFGLLLAQTVGLIFSTPNSNSWRTVFFISGLLCTVQFLFSATVADTPSWLTAAGRDHEAKVVASKLAGGRSHSPVRSTARDPSSVEAQGLLSGADQNADRQSDSDIPPLTALELFKVEALRKPVLTIILAMFAQQISGINAVIFYSNAILARVIPGAEGYISLGIAVLNAIMTFPAHLGRRKLLLGSMAATYVSLIALAVGLNKSITLLSSIAILSF
ncbi:hypothetical protein FRB99_001294, partial [Tulasnella sp. 403]